MYSGSQFKTIQVSANKDDVMDKENKYLWGKKKHFLISADS